MENILNDMRKVILLFDKLFKKDIKINIYTPLPADNDENFDLNILCRFSRLKNSFSKKVTFKNYNFMNNADINIFFNYERAVKESKIKINKAELLSDRLITITFSYKNKQDLNKMFFTYSDFMELFLNPLEINLKK